jgi:hypothetical protein
MRIVWPASTPVALAYLDQLTRSKGIQPARARAAKSVLERADGLRTGNDKAVSAAIDQLDGLAREFESDAGTAGGRDAARLRSLAVTIKGRAAKLRQSS